MKSRTDAKKAHEAAGVVHLSQRQMLFDVVKAVMLVVLFHLEAV